MFRPGNTVLVKNTVNSVYAGDAGIVLEIVMLITENPTQDRAVHVAFDGGMIKKWFHEDALALVPEK